MKDNIFHDIDYIHANFADIFGFADRFGRRMLLSAVSNKLPAKLSSPILILPQEYWFAWVIWLMSLRGS